ncbi:hypothetical protein B0H66DRAFT_632195 [Apodospora peruviana]|uniref:Uncharacterized protein n=1 Tax=Apodospora peruviana TaxID=516989 RepID=A0AAE0HUG9_9PEZI|nr:hypothetical protein B0H66DRAFT_632195 [Apodospora peruviana]
MAISDVPPADCPPWLVPVHTLLLGIGVLCWDATYILMTRRALATKSYGMPLLALAVNLSWEMVYVFYVCEAVLETTGFFVWLLLDIGLVYTTIRFGPHDWKDSSPWVGRNIGCILGLLTAVGCVGHYTFAVWWLAEPGRGIGGDKRGKWWQGREGLDTTELAFWSAGLSQLNLSAGSVAMLLVRGHSGGTGYAIWFFRTMGTLFGLILDNAFMWWYWPAGYGFIVSPFAVFIWGTSMACDIVYPFLLWQVRRTELLLPDGRLVRCDSQPASTASSDHGKKKR